MSEIARKLEGIRVLLAVSVAFNVACWVMLVGIFSKL